MDELISKQAAVSRISDLLMLELKGRRLPTWDEVNEALNELPSAQQWIPVSERLPEANGRYLVTRGFKNCGAMWNRVYIVNYSDLMGLKSERIWWSGNVGKSDFERIDGVIAWMPLLEPWKGGEDGEIH